MINLIPPAGLKSLKREYVLHVCATFSFLLGGAMVVLTIATIPVYVLVSSQIDARTLVSEREREEDNALATIENEIKKTKEILAQLRTTDELITPSSVIQKLEKLAPTGISFKAFSVIDAKNRIGSVQIQGTASTRETLVQFKNAIEAEKLFTSAEVPLADLARDIDLPFTIVVTVSEDTSL